MSGTLHEWQRLSATEGTLKRDPVRNASAATTRTAAGGRLFASDGHDVGRGAENGRFALHFADGGEQALALNGIVPQAVEIPGKPAWAFDGRDGNYLKSSGQ